MDVATVIQGNIGTKIILICKSNIIVNYFKSIIYDK